MWVNLLLHVSLLQSLAFNLIIILAVSILQYLQLQFSKQHPHAFSSEKNATLNLNLSRNFLSASTWVSNQLTSESRGSFVLLMSIQRKSSIYTQSSCSWAGNRTRQEMLIGCAQVAEASLSFGSASCCQTGVYSWRMSIRSEASTVSGEQKTAERVYGSAKNWTPPETPIAPIIESLYQLMSAWTPVTHTHFPSVCTSSSVLYHD